MQSNYSLYVLQSVASLPFDCDLSGASQLNTAKSNHMDKMKLYYHSMLL